MDKSGFDRFGRVVVHVVDEWDHECLGGEAECPGVSELARPDVFLGELLQRIDFQQLGDLLAMGEEC